MITLYLSKNVLYYCLGYIICVKSNWINISYEYFQFLITENLYVEFLFVLKPSNYGFCICIMCNLTKHTNSNLSSYFALTKDSWKPLFYRAYLLYAMSNHIPFIFTAYCIMFCHVLLFKLNIMWIWEINESKFLSCLHSDSKTGYLISFKL